jgi:hypothetical protein
MEGNGIQPVMPVSGGYGDGFGCGGGMWFMWLVVIFALMGGGGFGFGNRAGLTQAEMQAGFNHQDEMSQIRGIGYGISDATFSLNNSILNGQAELGRNIMQGNYGLEKTMMQNGWGISQQLNENRFAQQNCCCETNRNIDSVKAENYQNTCKITTAIHEEAEKTRGLITANTMQELRDRLADRDRDLQTARFNLSQTIQSAAIVNQLRPYPQPAYITASPYQSAGYGTCNGVVV